MSSPILIVDDEPDTLELIEFNLKAAGFRCLTAGDGTEALRKAREFHPQLIILDLMIPEIDGLEVCKLLRRDVNTASIPIIMLTAKASEIDRVLGLELGANDYLTKPFSPRELVLRIKNLLKKDPTESEQGDTLRVGELVVDIPRHLVTVNRKPVELTATEFKLLTTLMKQGANTGTTAAGCLGLR